MQTLAKTDDTSHRRSDHEAGAEGISTMPPAYTLTTPVQAKMREGSLSINPETETDLSATTSAPENAQPVQQKAEPVQKKPPSGRKSCGVWL